MRRATIGWLTGLAVSLASSTAGADQPMTQLQTWSGSVNFFATGAPLAVDGPDVDVSWVDQLLPAASVEVAASDLPATYTLHSVYLYWGGSITEDACLGNTIDDVVDFTPPGGNTTSVTADACYCSTADANFYDEQLCRKDVTSLVTDAVGTFTVGAFNAFIDNATTNNASFALVFVYASPSLPPRRVALWDGLRTMGNDSQVITLSGIDVDIPAEGDLAWYVLEGDIGGSMGEQVSVTGQPGGLSTIVSDALNPVDNPMNRTINTTVPPQSDTIGVDIDRFSIDAALTTDDSSVEMTYQAGDDKWWIAFNIVSVNVYEPAFGAGSTKSWTLQDDADGNGQPSPGDTIRYTIRLENTGTAPGVVSITDVIPAEAASWTVVDDAGATNASTMNELIVQGITVAPASSEDVVLDVVIRDVPDGTVMNNVCAFDATPDGDAGMLVAPPVVISLQTGGTGGAGGTAGVGGKTGSGGDADPSTVTTGGGPPESTVADGGCGCRTVGGSDRGAAWALFALIALGLRRRAVRLV